MKSAILISFLLVLLAIAGIAAFSVRPQERQNSSRGPREALENLGEKRPAPKSASPATNMILEEKLGQMLMVGFESPWIDGHARRMITQYHVGGINLLKRNVEGKEQVEQLAADLQDLAKIPLFIAADQEGGSASRFDFLNELTPQLQIKDPLEAKRVAFTRARELGELGVNMNFSPVLDYVSDTGSYLYGRTFGANSDTTGELGIAMIKGYLDGGVIPVAKHFPGYGNTSLDPHKKQTALEIENKELELLLAPFRKVVADAVAPAIMTAHILIPQVDSKPATLSLKFLDGILRKQMGFDGVIITDDLEMTSVGEPIEQAAVRAVKAGADIIVSTYTPEKQIKIFNRLKEAVASGEIEEKRIDESVERILKLKSLL